MSILAGTERLTTDFGRLDSINVPGISSGGWGDVIYADNKAIGVISRTGSNLFEAIQKGNIQPLALAAELAVRYSSEQS